MNYRRGGPMIRCFLSNIQKKQKQYNVPIHSLRQQSAHNDQQLQNNCSQFIKRKLSQFESRLYSSSRNSLPSSSSSSSSSSSDDDTSTHGTKIIVKSTPLACDPSHPMASYIDHSIQNPHVRQKEKNQIDTNFSITFLGTGAGGRPNAKRAPTSTALRISGHTFLFDAGEGTQRQLSLSTLGIKDVEKVFITHMHADHVQGLLGILLMKEMGAKSQREESNQKVKFEIYGPEGLYNYIAMNVGLTFAKIRNLEVVVFELTRTSPLKTITNDHSKSGPSRGNRRNKSKKEKTNFWHRKFPELSRTNIRCKSIAQNSDRTWTIQQPLKPSIDSVPGRNTDQLLFIRAAEVEHVSNVQTFGYIIEESEPLPKMDADKAINLGVSPGPKYRALKNGFSVLTDDGTREVTPQEVIQKSAKKARKLVVLGDAWKIPFPMRNMSFGADLLIHEATLSKNAEKLRVERGHSTAKMAGNVAKEMKSKVLVMNHISGKRDGNTGGQENEEEGTASLVEEAKDSNNGTSHVLVAHDFMSIHIPNAEGERNPLK